MTYNKLGGSTRSCPPRRPRRTRGLPFALGLLAPALLLAGCAGGESSAESAREESAAASPPVPAPASGDGLPAAGAASEPSTATGNGPGETEVDETPIDAVTPLTADGWGPLRIGMTRAEVIAAAGEDANPDAVGGPDPASCDEFRPRRAPRGLLVMIENGRLTRISVGSGSELESDRGIGIGDGAAEVRRTYGDRAESTPHKYVAAPAEYLTVWTVPPPAAAARGLVYEVGLEGRVSRIHAGGSSIRYVEGCL